MDRDILANGGMFSATTVDPTYMIYTLLGMALIISVIIYGSYRYKRYKKMQEFSDEMAQVGLNSEEESALTSLVKQYAMQEPVQILLSLRMFDEMACQEISRVLGSSGSTKAKDHFVQMIYDIRKKTYFPDWDKKRGSSEGEESSNENPQSEKDTHGINRESAVMS